MNGEGEEEAMEWKCFVRELVKRAISAVDARTQFNSNQENWLK